MSEKFIHNFDNKKDNSTKLFSFENKQKEFEQGNYFSFENKKINSEWENHLKKLFDNDAYKKNLDQTYNKYRILKNSILTISANKEKLLSKHIKTTDVTTFNRENVNSIVDSLFKNNKEWIRQNFDINPWDKVIWNEETQKLVIYTKEWKFVFSIRFSNYSPKENKEINNVPRSNLGNWITKVGPYPGKNNSCGASCWALLNKFWFRKILPQSGRDWKNWDTILERYASQYFDKVPVSHPDQAPAGSVIVFNENARLGSSARKKYWHVEIKGSDWKYYSYYKSVNAWWSSRTNEKNPQKYKKLTWFTGYAYVYNGKKPPR